MVTKPRPKRDRAAYMRSYRARKRAEALGEPEPVPKWPDDPADALARWSREKLKVPAGHPKAGEPMELPAFGVRFIADALAHRESLLCVARKSGKSAVIAVYVLGRLAGPLRTAGYRCGVTSVSREKASELWMQARDIAEASDLEGLTFRKVPRRILGPSGRCEILSADRSAGHASSFDDAIIDELGLLAERDRELVAGMLSSVSAKNGRFMALSIRGDSPFTTELIGRREDPAVAVHHYRAPADCELDDRAAWAAANPSLGTVKSADYMADAARRALAVPADAAAFRAFDLNQSLSPSRQMICSVADWKACETDALPKRSGVAYVGWDIGGSASMTCAAALWPATGRMEAWCAFPDTPELRLRSISDGCRGQYQEMVRRGELRTYPGRVTPVSAFLADVAADLAGERVGMAGADRYRKAEARQALEAAGVRWPMAWRGTGASKSADGSPGNLRVGESLAMRKAIADSALRFDPAGNPALSKGRSRGRIDLLSSAVIAAGLAKMHGPKRRRRWRRRGPV